MDELIDLLYSPTETIIFTFVLPVIMCLGVIFNSTFLFVGFRVSKVRSDTTIYMLHLALADCIFLISSVYYSMFWYFSSAVRSDNAFTHSVQCIAYTLVSFLGYFTPMTLITMMSFERYLALCHPLKHLKIRGRRRTLKIVKCCWLIGIVFAILMISNNAILQSYCLRWSDNGSQPKLKTVLVTFCSPIYPWMYYYAAPLADIPYLTVVIVNIYMFTRIIVMLNKRRSADGLLDKDKRALQIRNRVAKMLIVNGVIFFTCQTPYVVVALSLWFCDILGIPTSLQGVFSSADRWILLLPTLVNTIVNPVIYGVMNAHYRAAFRQAFGCKPSPDGRPQVQNIPAVNARISTVTQDNDDTADPNTIIESRGTRI